MRLRLLLLVALAACARGQPGVQPDGSPGADGPRDGADAPADAPVDAPPVAGPVPLLLTEVALTPNTAELIELANPTDQIVSLDGYYLSDSGAYFRLPAGAPTVDATDFIVRFPLGAVIGPRAVITIAVDVASAYEAAYGVAPTYSIASGTMLPVATNGVAQLTNAGEVIVLFYWNGEDDLVRDVDLMIAGIPSAANALIDKSGIELDGPDADELATAYAADAHTMPVQLGAPATGRSTKRIALEAGHEVQAGTGNGLTGDDETTEDILATWDQAFVAPTPGTLPPGLIP